VLYSLKESADSNVSVIDNELLASPFSTADPNASTAIERRGYLVVRDEINAFVSGTYLDPFFALDSYIFDNMVRPFVDADSTVDCSGGGAASLSAQGFANRTVNIQFSDCLINNTEVDGNIMLTDRRDNNVSTETQTRTWNFSDVTVSGSSVSTRLTGSVQRVLSESASAPMFAEGCVSDDPQSRNFTTRITYAMDSVERTDATTSTTIRDASYLVETISRLEDPTGNVTGPCARLNFVFFNGLVDVASTELGQLSISKSGISDTEGSSPDNLSEQIDIDSETGQETVVSGPAQLAASFDDGSSLQLTHPQAMDFRAAVTVNIGDAVTTFEDSDFRMEF